MSLEDLSCNETGMMSAVDASPNDPIFVNHHAMLDGILDEWILANEDEEYTVSPLIREGHRADDYIVPFIPLYTQESFLKPASDFGYECNPRLSDNALFTAPSILFMLTAATLTLVVIVGF